MEKNINIARSKSVLVNSNIITEGHVLVGSHNTINYNNFREFEEIKKRKENIEHELNITPDNEGNKAIRLYISKKLLEVEEEENLFKDKILTLAETFSRIEINTERLKLAQTYFFNGDEHTASALLKLNELERDQKKLLESKKRTEARMKEINQQLRNNASEFLIKAQITAHEYDQPEWFDEAVRYFKKSIESFSFYENNLEFATFLHHNNKLIDSKVHYQQALKDPEVKEDERAEVYLYLGHLFSDQNDYDNALQFYEKALEIRREANKEESLNSQLKLVQILDALGVFYQKFEKLKKALSCFEEASSLLSKLKDVDEEEVALQKITILNNIGRLYQSTEVYDKAYKNYQKAIAIFDTIEARKPDAYHAEKAALIFNSAALLHEQGKKQKVAPAYQEALKIYEQLAQQNPFAFKGELIVVRLNLAAYFCNIKTDKAKSLDYAHQAIALLEESSDELPSKEGYLEIAQQVFKHWGIDENS